jgi:hypothetical protein
MTKVKRYNENGYVTSDDSNSGMKEAYDEGALERANSSAESQSIADEAKGEAMLKSMRDKAAMAKPKLKAKSSDAKSTTPKAVSSGAMDTAGFEKTSAPDVTKMSVSERMKASRDNARSGVGTTDTRSVGQRLRAAFGMASGGMASSASKRADGIAQKGKTRGKMC